MVTTVEHTYLGGGLGRLGGGSSGGGSLSSSAVGSVSSSIIESLSFGGGLNGGG